MKSLKRRQPRRGGRARYNPMSAIVRAPPGTTTITIPGELAAIDTASPYEIAFSLDANSILATGSYINIATVYKYYRVKRVSLEIFCPTATTATGGQFSSSLQYIVRQSSPNAISQRNILNLRPNKTSKMWECHKWLWRPREPSDFTFNAITDQADYATIYVGADNVTNFNPGSQNQAFLLRFIATVEFYGLNGVSRNTLPPLPSPPKSDDDQDEMGNYALYSDYPQPPPICGSIPARKVVS